jgi:lipoprotein-anchoring transpeptidase ErfK/SrfK
MYRILLVAGLAMTVTEPAAAQSWVPWHQPSLLGQPQTAAPAPKATAQQPTSRSVSGNRSAPAGLTPMAALLDDDDDDDERAVPRGPVVLDGGARPAIQPQSPPEVSYHSSHPRGTIVVDTAARRLYLIQSSERAFAYPVSVGREGFTWTGTERISRIADWPDWHPPAEMRERDPKLPTKMTGGVRNPLGAKALYLGSTLYRIHGTSDARSIGRASSSGCFRMHNKHVVDLSRRVGVGTRVVVVNRSGSRTASSEGGGRRSGTR